MCVWFAKKWGTGQDKNSCPVFDLEMEKKNSTNNCTGTEQLPTFLLPAKVGDNFLSSGQINGKSYFIPRFSCFFTYALCNILKPVHSPESPPSLWKPTKPPSLIPITLSDKHTLLFLFHFHTLYSIYSRHYHYSFADSFTL
jgi:hypothetical protein